MATARKKLLIINILDILNKYTDTEHTLSVSEICKLLKDEYDMSADRKAVKNNLMDLIEFGYKIEYSETERINKNGEREVIMGDWYLVRDFTDAELRLIIDSLLFSKHIPYNQCKELIGKIEGLSNTYFRRRMRHVRNMPDNLPRNPELFLTIEVLDEAISRGKQVEFEYCYYAVDKKLHSRIDSKGGVKKYVVNPYQMVATNGKYYLIGNFDYYNDVNHYRLDRIKHIRLLDTPAKPAESLPELKDGLQLPTHMAEHLYMFVGQSGMVNFVADKRIINDIIDWFGKDVRFFNETETEVSVAVRVNYTSMKYWAMQYGTSVRVTAPQTLVDQIKEELMAVAMKYNT